MKILMSLTYYLPYISGLSLYAQRIAEGLEEKGYQVEIFTSGYERFLKQQEKINGILVTRVPYFLKFNKGLIMPSWFWKGFKKVQECDCVICHLPQVEGLWLLLLAKLFRKRSLVVYQCDVVLPNGGLNKVVEKVLKVFGLVSCVLADKIVVSSLDYSRHSPVLSKFEDKLIEVCPPIKDFSAIKSREGKISGKMAGVGYRVGFVGRLSTDKGVEYLLEAIPFLEKGLGNFKVFLAGPQDAIGEKNYVKKIKELLRKYFQRVVLLGKLSDEELAFFYQNIEVLVLPSVNSTEAFGMVQAEAMLNNVPVIVSNLPGARVPVKKTGMGEIVPIAKPEEIAKAVLKIIKNRNKYQRNLKSIGQVFSSQKAINDYEKLIFPS